MKRERKEKFSIRKFSFGAASCLIGAQIAISGLANQAEAAMVTTRNDKGLVTLYANRGESPYDAAAIAVHDSINVDREIVVDVDWSSYSKTNPYVTVTYKYNGGFGASNYVANYGGSRPDYWFTTPVGAQEPSEIRLQTGTTDRVMKSWSADSPWVSFTNSVGSRYQTKDQVDSMGLGDDTKWERYNDTTQETGKTFHGDMAGMFNHRIGTQISDSPSDQGIFESFRTNTKSIYSDWDLARNDRITITAKYKVADPTLKNGRRTLDFGAGVKVGRALQQLRHFKVVTTEIPVLYQDKELFEPVLPERIGVVDTAKLTAEEKTQLKNKIWEKNQDTTSDAIPEHSHNKFIENVKEGDDGIASANSSISIADDGTATITYGDGTQDVIPGTSLVYEKPQIDNIETTPANVGDYKYLKNPHAVDNINSLTGSDIASARQKFFQVNGMTTTKNEDGDDVITAVGDPSKTSQDFVGTNLEYDSRSQGFAVVRRSMPTGITIPKADLFKAKPTKVFSAAEAIEKAKQAIDNLTYLSPKEKENYKNQLTGKTTQDDINKVVNTAIAKNSENEKAIEAKKRQVKDKINSAKYLTEAEKEAFRKQVDSQGITDPANGDGTGNKAADYTKELLDKIGQQVDAKNLENAKKSTKEKIDQIKDSLKKPTADEYKTQVDGKTTVAEVEKVLEEAEKQKAKNEAQKAQEEAEKLKEEYKKQIDQIPGLSEADKAKYKQQIDQAKSKDQLENILNDAKAQATREKAKQTIEDLPHLNKAQKDELKEKVENASDKSEIDGIVSIAQGLDSKMDSLQKLVAEAEKVKASDKYTNPNVPQDKKTAFDKAKDAASKVADKTTAAPENAVGTSEVATLIDNLAKAIKELTGHDVAVPVSKDALKAEIDLNKDDAVKKSPAYAKEKDAAKKKAYDDALANAQKVYDKKDATQPQVDEALDKLQQARLALSGKAEDFTLAVTEAAKISKEPKVGESLTEQADKDAVKAKLTANGKALDNTYAVEYGAIADKDGKKVVPVIVTRDGVSKTINVEVTKKAEEFTLAVKDETKPAKISKVPVVGESLTVEDQAKVKEKVIANGEALKDTDTVTYGTITEKEGKKVVPVTVTRNGVSKTVEVPVEGNTAATTTPTVDTAKLSETPVKDSKVTKAEDVQKVKEAIKVPEGTQVTDKKLLDEGKVVEGTDQTANGGANNAGKPVVKVEVTYADGSKDVVEVPVEGNTAATTTPTVDTAKLSETPKENDTVTKPEDVKAIKDAVKVTVPAGQKEPTKELVDGGKVVAGTDQTANGGANNTGKPVVKVEVTYADGSKDVVEVPVEGNTAATTTPTVDTAKLSETPKVNDTITKPEDVKAIKDAVKVTVPAGQKEPTKELADGGKVVAGTDQSANGGANNTGKPVVKVEVTYADGSKDVVEVPVEGNTAATTTPTVDTAKLSETPKENDTITKPEDVKAIKDAVKVPEGTQVTDKKLLDEGKVVEGTDQTANGGANNTGKPVVKVEVTYADGSKDVVEVPVEGTDAAKATPKVKEEITSGEIPVSVDPSKDKQVAEADKKAITDAVVVPEGQPQPKDKQVKNDGAIVDGTGANTGKKVVVVEVTYPDGSKDEIEVPVRKEKDADKATPKVKEEIASGEVPVSVDPAKDKKAAEADKKAITDAVEVPKDQPQPADKQVKNDGAIVEGTGANAGKKVVVVEVTYPDGSKDEIEVPVRKVTDKEKAKADLTDAANTEKGEIGGDATLTDKEKEDLKAKVDEVKKVAEDKINNAKTPEEIAKATEEGKKAIADVYNPQASKGKSTSIFKPELDLQTALVSGKATVEKGKDLTDEEILKQLALVDGVTAKVISKPTTTETGTKEAEVEVTLADGTKVTVKVPVEVVESLEKADKDNDLAKAKEDAKKQVEEAAKAKLEEIKKDKDLTAEQKQKAEEVINKAKEEANKAIDEASSAGTAKQIADQAKENIEKYNPKADIEVKKPDVTNLDEEKAKAKAEILEEAQKRINEIKNNKDLTDEEKQKAIESVNKEKDKAIEDINKGQSKDEINEAKETGIHKINEVQPEESIASKFEPKVPENKVEVENPSKLSDKERDQIRQNIEGANTFPDGTTVEVKPDGTAVITYKDGSSDTISKDKLVTPAKKNDGTKKDEGTIASRTEPVIPGKTQVGNTTKLTPEEQAAVKKAVEEANKFPAGTTVEVRPDGTVVITYPDKSVDTITGDKLVEKSTKQTTPKVKTEAEKNPAQVPGRLTPVENTHNLTQTEQDTVAAKVKAANPATTDVKVSKDGTATLTYGDGSVNTISGTSLVVAKDADNETATQATQNPAVVPVATEVGNTTKLTPAEQSAVAAKVKQVNPTATAVTVSKDGTATLTYGDGSVNTIPGTSLVVQKEEVPTQDQPTIAEKTKVIIPANPTKVAEATRLTDEEKEAVRKSIVEANGFGSDVRVEVAGDGTATIIFKDGSAITIPGRQLVAQDSKAQDSNKTDAEKTAVKAPSQRVDVKDITHLTDEEKEKVKVAILQANGSALDGATIEVAGDGTAIITFPDGSVVIILGKDTVQQSAKGESLTQEPKPEYTPESTPGQDNGGNTGSLGDNANAGGGRDTGVANTGNGSEAGAVNADVNSANKENAKGGIQGALAHTGLDNTGGLGLAGLGLAMLGGLLTTAKRRKEK